MSLTLRHFLFPEGGKPVRLSQRLTDGLVAGTDWLPDYANSRQRVLTVVIETVDGKPERIYRTEASIWSFDKAGGIVEGLRESLGEALDSFPSPKSREGTVVPIGPVLRRKSFEKKYRWKPEQSDLDLVAADIWPKGQPQLEVAKGVSPKKPPMTHEAKHALREATEPFWRIANAISSLKEPSLAALAFEARSVAGLEEYAPLYRALAELADTRLAILRQRRSGKGVWYALVEVLRWESDMSSGELIACFHERCEGKKAAVLAGCRLLIKHANKLADDITVEARLETELEWETAARMSVSDAD